MKLVDYIGKPAMLEQTAEECVELAHACLKMARFLRDENKVHGKTKEELYKNLHEEAADVTVCMNEMINGDILDENYLTSFVDAKTTRMKTRLEKAGERWMVYGIDSEHYSDPIVHFCNSYKEAKKWIECYDKDGEIEWERCNEMRCTLSVDGHYVGEEWIVFEIFKVTKPYILLKHSCYDGVYPSVRQFDTKELAYAAMYDDYRWCMNNWTDVVYDSCWFKHNEACIDDNNQWHYWGIIKKE